MTTEDLVKDWFAKWENGDFDNLPVSDDFVHTSPFGVIEGKESYLDVVRANKDKFLGYHFQIHDQLFLDDRACVRYTGKQGDFSLEVSEWYKVKNHQIKEVIAYYHIGEIREERKLE